MAGSLPRASPLFAAACGRSPRGALTGTVHQHTLRPSTPTATGGGRPQSSTRHPLCRAHASIESVERLPRARSALVALAVAVGLGTLVPACGFEEPPYRKSIDATDAAGRVEQRGVHVPDGFEFAQGFVWPINSVGTSAFAVRYDGPADQFRTLRAADVGRGLIDFEDLPCASIPSPGASEELVELGLNCPAGGGARITRTQRLHGGQSLDLGTHAVVLNPTPAHTQLFVLCAGT